MELGNLFYGHSRGEFEVPREERWEEPLFQLLNSIDESAGVYGTHFSNDVFEVRPYYWGDCTCGKDEPQHGKACDITTKHGQWISSRLAYSSGEPDEYGFASIDFSRSVEFEQSNPYPTCTCGASDQFAALERDRHAFIGIHTDDCYQARLQAELVLLGDGDDVFGSPAQDEIYKRLTAEFGLSMAGCAVHCTCQHHSLIEQWELSHPHAADCAPTLPNFRHFASGLEVRWYKYAIRDSYMNQDLTCEQWWAVMAECCSSLRAPQ